MSALLLPGWDDYRGCGIAIGVVGQPENLTTSTAMTCPGVCHGYDPAGWEQRQCAAEACERWDQAVAWPGTAPACTLACPPGESSGCPRSASLARRGSQNPIANALASSPTVASVVH